MSWSIGNLENTVKISAACAKELFEAQGDDGIWSELEDVTYEGCVTFNPDHMEGMDWLSQSAAPIEVLLRHKVKGDICFGDIEGDSAGSFWGYRFDGEGGMTKLKGSLVWVPEGKRIVAKPVKKASANIPTVTTSPDSLNGKTVVVTGVLDGVTRDEANGLIGKAGGIPCSTVTRKTNYLVVGDKSGSKVDKAAKLGVARLTPEQFFALVKK